MACGMSGMFLMLMRTCYMNSMSILEVFSNGRSELHTDIL